MSDWLLAAAYFVHMVATIVWVGGLTLMAVVIWPAARRVLGPGRPTGEFLAEVQRRFSPLAIVSLAALAVTGLMQMSANANYEGLFRLTSIWAQAIFLKHLAFLVMTVIGVYLTWGLLPALSRLALLEALGKPAPEVAALRLRQERLHQVNVACGLLVLAFTAVARVS